MSTSRLVRSLVVAAGLCVWAGAGPRARGQEPAQPPTFRTDASFVLTDVFVTADGKPVTDLTAADFELREDGVVQSIRSFEAIQHKAESTGIPRRNPSTVAESNAMAADPRRRVLVFFIDTFHVDRGASMQIRKQVQSFLKTALGPDDLIAYMVPQMSGGDISFSSSTDSLIRYFDDNPIWGVADELPGSETDDVERSLQSCFAGDDAAWLPLRSRLREEKSLQALRGLVSHLDGIRESRKAVIALTRGWHLFTDNPTRMSDQDTSGRVVGVQPIGVGPDGRLGTPDRTRGGGGVDRGKCDTVRLLGSFSDSRQLFRDLIGEANRSSTSFYTVDAAGLRTETRPIPTTGTGAAIESRNRERQPFTTTLDSIRDLGASTNGMAIVDSNDIEGGLRRAAADFNAYYLLGYTSTNGKADGRYRKIKVTVKRPGVQVRAREGYLARRADEKPPASAITSAGSGTGATSENALLTAALGKLAPARAGVPFVVAATAGAIAGGSSRVIRVVAELDPTVAATPEWAEGGEAQAFVRSVTGQTITSGKAQLAKGARTLEIELPVVEGMKGDVKVQVRMTGQGPLARYTDTTTVALDSLPDGWGAPRMSRRGPSTGIAWVPTADPRFRRQERLRVSVGAPAAGGTVAGSLLDRTGKAMNVPVKVDQSEPTTLVAELALAPLAAGDYVLALGGGPGRLLVPLRVVN